MLLKLFMKVMIIFGFCKLFQQFKNQIKKTTTNSKYNNTIGANPFLETISWAGIYLPTASVFSWGLNVYACFTAVIFYIRYQQFELDIRRQRANLSNHRINVALAVIGSIALFALTGPIKNQVPFFCKRFCFLFFSFFLFKQTKQYSFGQFSNER